MNSSHPSRPSWDDIWVQVAAITAGRSLCSRAQVGAVIIDSSNRVIATGYNGPPSGFEHLDQPCSMWCPRGMGISEITNQLFDDCYALHAEANALITADRSAWQGGAIYVMGDICFNCAKLIANSGLAAVIVQQEQHVDRSYRQSHRSYKFLETCGLDVVVNSPE